MVRPPKIRHSKARRDPVTIELDPADVTRESAATGPKTKAPGSKTANPGPKPAGQEPAMTKTASDATPAAKDAPIRTVPAEETAAAAKAEATKSSPGTPDATPEARSPAADQPVFGRDASAPAASRAAPPPPPRPTASPSGSAGADRSAPKRGGLSMIAAGVIGGIVVLAGAGALQNAGVLPSPGSSVEPGEPAGLADLRAELASLRDQIAAGGAAAQPDPAQAARLDELASALDQIRTDVTELRSAISQGEGGDAAGLQALDQRMSELETTVASLGQNAGTGTGETVDLAPLTGRIDAVESQLAEVSRAAQAASEASAGLPDRIAALDTRVGELSARIEDQAANPRIALAIAAAGLKAAIDRGDPFMTELETYASIAPNAPEIADLRDLAATGVPTRAAISQEVDAAANRMIAAAAPSPGDAGFFGRLLDSMQSVIKVRPVGDVEGDDVGAIVARLEAAILAGDYDRAVSQYEALPEPARQAGAEFIASVKARQTADALVERALSGALRPQEG